MSWDPFSTTERASGGVRTPNMEALMTPRGNTLRSVRSLHRRRVIDDRDVAILKDAVVDGNDISGIVSLLEECTPNDRFKVDSIIMKAPRPRQMVAKNSFRALRNSPKPAARAGKPGLKSVPSFGDLFASPGTPRAAHSRVAALRAGAGHAMAKKGSFSDLAAKPDPFASVGAAFVAAPAPSGTASPNVDDEAAEVLSVTDDDWFNFGAAPAPAPAAASAPAPPPPAATSAATAAAPTPPAAAAPGAGAGAGAGAAASPTVRRLDPELAAAESPRASPVKSGAEVGEARGLLWVRESHYLLKGWKSRYVVLSDCKLYIYEGVAALRLGEAPLSIVRLTRDTELGPLKTTEHNKKRLHYREVARTVPKHERLFKFGCETMPGVSKWATALRVALQQVEKKEAQQAADRATMEAVVHPTKATFKESTTTRGTRNIFNRRGSLDDESKETLISIELLNHDKVDVLAKPKDTLLDVCLAVRDQLGLENDGDFSIFLRDHEEYSCLPEQMLAIAADASALSDARSLVYRRRICMDSNQPINQEAAKATDITQAAHRLLFGEAVFQVVHGYYLISNDDAHKLAALHLLSEIGAGQPDPSVRRQLRTNLPHYVSALCSLKRDKDEVVEAVRSVYVTLRVTELEAQRQYMTFCQALPEYGARFFVGTMFRFPSSRGDGQGNPARTPPAWLAKTRKESGMEVLVGINPSGVYVRPPPPRHDLSYKPEPQVDVTSPWYLHPTRHIEVWGTKNKRPVLTYRVREATVMDVQVHSPSYKEMASVIHMYVYQLLADREGRKAPPRRMKKTPVEEMRAEVAAQDSQAPLQKNWVEIQDPLTGEVCWWNQVTKVTVWTRPTQVTTA